MSFITEKKNPNTGAEEVGAQGAQLHTQYFSKWQLSQAFRGKKNFENRSKIDQSRGKNVNCAPNCTQLPPPLE